jgi:hypothetical protein
MIFLPAVVALDDIIGSIFFIFMDYYVKMLYGCNLGVYFFLNILMTELAVLLSVLSCGRVASTIPIFWIGNDAVHFDPHVINEIY